MCCIIQLTTVLIIHKIVSRNLNSNIIGHSQRGGGMDWLHQKRTDWECRDQKKCSTLSGYQCSQFAGQKGREMQLMRDHSSWDWCIPASDTCTKNRSSRVKRNAYVHSTMYIVKNTMYMVFTPKFACNTAWYHPKLFISSAIRSTLILCAFELHCPWISPTTSLLHWNAIVVNFWTACLTCLGVTGCWPTNTISRITTDMCVGTHQCSC